MFEQEPLPADHPLWTMPGVLITPHTAGYGPLSGRAALRDPARQLPGASWPAQPLRNVVDKAQLVLMPARSGGHLVVELLKAEGVRYIFGIVGATFLDVLDALYDDRSVEYINVRHEQAAAFMADGLARVTGPPGVCLVTSGPGATNLLTGVAAAYVAHSPVVVAGRRRRRSSTSGKDAFQEYDLVGMFRPVTKLAVQVNQPERIPELLRDGAARGDERPARARCSSRSRATC